MNILRAIVSMISLAITIAAMASAVISAQAGEADSRSSSQTALTSLD